MQRFSPDSLETQTTLTKYFGDMPIYWSRSEPRRYPLVDFLIKTGEWTPSNECEPKAIVTYEYSPRNSRGSMTFAYKLLARDADRWIEWTKQHPEVAAELWPRILNSLRNPAHSDETNGLLYCAQTARNADEFHQLASNIYKTQ